MPFSVTWEARGVIWTYFGQVTGEDILNSNMAIYGDERFDAMDYQIVDMTTVESFAVDRDDMTVIAAKDRAAALSNPSVRVAVVAPNPEGRRLSEFYEQESGNSPWEHRIFDTMEAARTWLQEPFAGGIP